MQSCIISSRTLLLTNVCSNPAVIQKRDMLLEPSSTVTASIIPFCIIKDRYFIHFSQLLGILTSSQQ